jgi:hypothetical protein
MVEIPECAAALRNLYDAHVPGLAELPPWSVVLDQLAFNVGNDGREARLAYVRDIRLMAEQWGLDRLLSRREELGAQLIHEWCRRAARTRGRDAPVSWLAGGLGSAQYVPDIGEVVDRQVFDLGDVQAVDQVARPVVRVDFKDEWDPRRESRAAARSRLEIRAAAIIRAELDRLSLDAEAKGYVFVDASPTLGRNLDWLVELVSRRISIQALIEREGPDDPDRKVEARVVKAVRRVAERAGVSVKGLGLSDR